METKKDEGLGEIVGNAVGAWAKAYMVFVALKLSVSVVADFSWWWVFCPWVPVTGAIFRTIAAVGHRFDILL